MNGKNSLKEHSAQVPIIYLPCLTAQKFSELVGLDVGVVEAQMDRRILPVFRLGKRRMVNLEALREQVIVSSTVVRIKVQERAKEFTL